LLVLGIDPGAVFTGFAWIREMKDLTVQRMSTTIVVRERYPFRYPALERQLLDLFTKLPEEPCAIVIEEPDAAVWKDNDVRPIFHLHGAYAVVVCAVCRRFHDSILHRLRPGSWNGHMPKDHTAKTLREKYGWADVHTGDEADALGLADFAFEVAKRTRAAPKDAVVPPPASQPPDEFGRTRCIHCGDTFFPSGRRFIVGPDGRGRIGSLPFCRLCGPIHGLLLGGKDHWIDRFERIIRTARAT